MNKQRHLLLAGLLLLLCAPRVAAQDHELIIDTMTGWKPDTVSVDEMKKSFSSWLLREQAQPEAASERFNDYSLFRVYATDADGNKHRPSAYLNSPKLQDLISPFSLPLPPGLWESSSIYIGRNGLDRPLYLQWAGPRKYYARGVDQKALLKKLKEHSYYVATWFSGPICLSSYTTTAPYCHTYVTTYAKAFEVEKGKFVGGPYELKCERGEYARRQQLKTFQFGPTSGGYGGEELTYFSDELQQQLAPDTLLAKGTATIDYSFLLTTDAAGKAHLHLLWPQRLTRQAWALVDRLSKAVEALPAGRFGHFFTTDGRIFPGRYLRFRYNFQQNRWHITDYLVDTRRPSDAPYGMSEWDHARNDRAAVR